MKTPAAVYATTALFWVAVAVLAGPAHAQCPAPTNLSASDGTFCQGVAITWSGARVGPTWGVYRSSNHQPPVLIGSPTANQFGDVTAQPGVEYDYYVVQTGAACGTHPGAAGPEKGSIGVPAAPIGVSASDGTACGAVHVTWNAALNAGSYDVGRSLSPDVADVTVIGNTSQTSFDDAGADPVRSQWYFVRAHGTAGCLGAWSNVPESGGPIAPLLPDLVLDRRGTSATQFFLDEAGRPKLFVFNIVANAGTMPLYIYPFERMYDGSEEFYERTIECGHQVDRLLGRFVTPSLPEIPNTFPNFVRVKLRERLADGSAGAELLRYDAPAACLFDYYVFDSTIAGWSSTPGFPECTTIIRGISIGWETIAPPPTPEFAFDLSCILNGTYILEREIDPEDRIRELDETNNIEQTEITFTEIPTPTLVCPRSPLVSRLLGPDSVAVATGATTDSLRAIVWAGDLTEADGPPNRGDFAELWYLPTDAAGRSVPSQERQAPQGGWTSAPAQWRRQDGADDVFVAFATIPTPGEYYYTFAFRDVDGFYWLSDRDGTDNGFQIDKVGKIRVQDTTGANGPAAAGALDFAVRSNPARGVTHFVVTLPEATAPRVTIHDARGRLVRALEPGDLPAGQHTIEWDGRSTDGVRAPAGVYFARLETARGARLAAKWVFAP